MRLLTGYYGERNAGDDAFTVICARSLHASGDGPIGVLAKRLPLVQLPDTRVLQPVREWRGLADRLFHWRTTRWLDRGAALLVGGGSVFRTARAMVDLEAIVAGHPSGEHAAIGISVGPFPSVADETAVGHTLRHFSRLGLRDRPSLQRARELAPHADSRLTFDLAPLLPEACPEVNRAVATSREGLGIALCGPQCRDDEIDQLAVRLLDWAPGRVEVIQLIEFNGGTTSSDRGAHARLAARLAPILRVETIHYNGDPRRTWQAIGSLRGLLAMRLHAAVFGYCTNTPTLVIPYEEKCTAWAAMCGQPDSLVSPLGAITAVHLDLIWSGAPRPSLPVSEAIALARGNFELLA